MTKAAKSEQFDWTKGTSEAHLAAAQRLSTEELRKLVARYDWSMHPEAVLGWALAQKNIDLGAVLSCFFKGDPQRFNYIPKYDLFEDMRPMARLLDLICLRVNSGFYLVWPDSKLTSPDQLAAWISMQKEDREKGIQGRFVLDEMIVKSVLEGGVRSSLGRQALLGQADSKTSLLRDIFSPILELGVSREDLKYLPHEDGEN